MPTASVVSTSPFITPIVTPVHTDVCTEVRQTENPGEVVTTVDLVAESLIDYLTNPIVVETVENNIGSEVELNGQWSKENEIVQPVEVNVIINEAGVQQPIESIGEILDELPKSRKRNDHIQELNIIVSTPVFDQCVSEFSMKKKQIPKFKSKELKKIDKAEKAAKEKQKGVGPGGAGAVPLAGTASGGGASRCRGRAPASAKPVGVPGKQASGQKQYILCSGCCYCTIGKGCQEMTTIW